MKKPLNERIVIRSVSEQHRLLSLPGPEHPLLSILRFEDLPQLPLPQEDLSLRFSMDFYTITLKKGCSCKLKYGQNYYDFDSGVMSFIAPGQVIDWQSSDGNPPAGWMLVVHPDLLRNHTLERRFKEYGFFSYALNEALHLSDKEEDTIGKIMQDIKNEYSSNMDSYSEEIMLSHIELLLSYCNRFYNRQFITRKKLDNDLLQRLVFLLDEYFDGPLPAEKGLPDVSYFADRLHKSPGYLGDMLRKSTGLSTQQHIQNRLIEKARELLGSSAMSVSEIAYALGFEYPQSFNKLFRKKTGLTPLAFRQSLN